MQALQNAPTSPTLPAPYPVMMVLSLFPPLWDAIMVPRALAARAANEALPLEVPVRPAAQFLVPPPADHMEEDIAPDASLAV